MVKEKKLKIAVIILAIAAALMAVAFVTVGLVMNAESKKMRLSTDAILAHSYYTLSDSINNIENDLSKIKVMTSGKMIIETLDRINVNASVSVAGLSALSRENGGAPSLTRYLNQVGDFSKSLSLRLMRGEQISAEEREIIFDMRELTLKISRKLAAFHDIMDESFSFNDQMSELESEFNGMMSDFENGSVEYPSLIYDGPFSDAIDDKEPVGLTGGDITREQGEAKAKEYLKAYSVSGVSYIGESTNKFHTYMYEASILGDRTASVQISKKGGHLVMMDVYKSVDEPIIGQEEAILLAEQYCADIKMPSMKAVWATNMNSTMYINLCYEKNGVIYYPDMVKVKIALDTGEVVGYEAVSYLYNHTERQSEEDVTVTEEEAISKVSDKLKVVSSRLALIPYSALTEKLCHEIYAEADGEKYFIYVCVKTGDELNVLRVIDSDNGELLM